MQKSKLHSIFALVSALACFTVCMTACAPAEEAGEVTHAGFEGEREGVLFSLPDLGENVSLHTSAQAAYLAGDSSAILTYANGGDGTENSYPAALQLSWEGGSPAYTIRLSEHPDLSSPKLYQSEKNTLDVYNLKAGTTYYWSVETEGAKSGRAAFTTSDSAPRNLKADGVANLRDLGGWKTADGAIKQGMLFRCGRLSANETGETTISPEGIKVCREELGIKTEIDLRGGSEDPGEYGNLTQSPLGEGVSYHHIGMNWNGNLFEINKKEICEVFSLLADQNNYPIAFHCSIGTDRTGLIAYLVEGLMGVSEEDLMRDYLFSNFADIGGTRTPDGITGSYGKTIAAYPGSTHAEKVWNALADIGVAEEDLAVICTLLAA